MADLASVVDFLCGRGLLYDGLDNSPTAGNAIKDVNIIHGSWKRQRVPRASVFILTIANHTRTDGTSDLFVDLSSE